MMGLGGVTGMHTKLRSDVLADSSSKHILEHAPLNEKRFSIVPGGSNPDGLDLGSPYREGVFVP